MTEIFIYFMLAIILLAVIVTLAVGLRHGRGKISDGQYMDGEGRHLYYDRSSIEKEEFARRNPGVKGVRTLKRLFKKG